MGGQVIESRKATIRFQEPYLGKVPSFIDSDNAVFYIHFIRSAVSVLDTELNILYVFPLTKLVF